MVSAPLEVIEIRARGWAQTLGRAAAVVEGESTIGGGSLPGGTLPTRLVAIGIKDKRKGKDNLPGLAARLRCCQPPIIGRVERNTVFLDPRTVLPEQDEALLKALHSIIHLCDSE